MITCQITAQTSLSKFADDTAVVDLINNDNETNYRKGGEPSIHMMQKQQSPLNVNKKGDCH